MPCFLLVVPYSFKLTAATGAFHFFNDAHTTTNALQRLAPSPNSISNLEPFFTSHIISNISTHSQPRRLYSLSLLIHLFPQRNYQILRSLSPLRMLLVLHQLVADELGGNHLGGTGEEGLGEVFGGRGGYGCGFGWWLL